MVPASKSTGKVLRIFLYITIGLDSILLICSYFLAFHFDFYNQYVELVDFVISIFQVPVLILSIIFYLIWLFRVHKDIHTLDGGYSISPGGALARVLIPFYNIWGLWNVYSTMAEQFKKSITTFGLGTKLRKYLPFYFVLYWVSETLNRYLTLYGLDGAGIVWFISYGMDLTLAIIYILMVKAVTTALHIKSNAAAEEKVMNGPDIVVDELGHKKIDG